MNITSREGNIQFDLALMFVNAEKYIGHVIFEQ